VVHGRIPICSIGAAVSTSLIWFAAFQIGLYAGRGAAGSGCVVMLSEELPIARRARGQSFGGPGKQRGSRTLRLPDADLRRLRMVVAMDVRHLALGIAMLPAMARLLPESERWERSDASGITERTHFYDVFQPLYRKRSITIIVCAFAAAISTTAATHSATPHSLGRRPVSGATSTMTIVAGGIALLGFPIAHGAPSASAASRQ